MSAPPMTTDIAADIAEVLPRLVQHLNVDFDRGARLVETIRMKLSELSSAKE